MKTPFRVVPDTNVVLASQTKNENSPNRELFDRWEQKEFQILYSHDTISEYFEKMAEQGIPYEEIKALVREFILSAEWVYIKTFHFPSHHYPKDPDDIAFILCTDNGNATHLVTYDKDLLDVAPYHSFKICETVPFLSELREIIA